MHRVLQQGGRDLSWIEKKSKVKVEVKVEEKSGMAFSKWITGYPLNFPLVTGDK